MQKGIPQNPKPTLVCLEILPGRTPKHAQFGAEFTMGKNNSVPLLVFYQID
jgi:hypothetical protein